MPRRLGGSQPYCQERRKFRSGAGIYDVRRPLCPFLGRGAPPPIPDTGGVCCITLHNNVPFCSRSHRSPGQPERMLRLAYSSGRL